MSIAPEDLVTPLRRPDMVEPVVSVTTPPLSVSVATAALLIGVSARTIEQLVASGALASFKIGSRRLIDLDDLRQFIADAKSAQ